MVGAVLGRVRIDAHSADGVLNETGRRGRSMASHMMRVAR
jgi:hypothetical protein